MKFSVHLIPISFLLAFSMAMPSTVVAQCAAPAAAGSCSGGNGAASNNININSGETYWYSGSGTFGNGVNMNGGTLRICGNLTMNNISFNSGIIYIEAGGSLTINGGGTLNLNGFSLIQNRGTLTINRSVTMQNFLNYIINASTSAVFNMNGGAYQLQINSSTSFFINYGTANINNIFVQGSGSAGAVCLGAGSCTNLTALTNNFTNSFNAPSGPASIRYTGNALLNNNLTGTSNLLVCRATGSTTSGGAGFGSAQVFLNCSGCASVLPIDLVSFQARTWSGSVVLNWRTASERNNKLFHIERSPDQQNWTDAGSIPGSGSTAQSTDYSWTDVHPLSGTSYYRLRQEDFDGRTSYSPVQQVSVEAKTNGLSVYPNPAHDRVQVTYSGEAIKMNLLDIYGRRLKEIPATTGVTSISVSELPAGTYFLRAGADVRKFVKD